MYPLGYNKIGGWEKDKDRENDDMEESLEYYYSYIIQLYFCVMHLKRIMFVIVWRVILYADMWIFDLPYLKKLSLLINCKGFIILGITEIYI